MPVTALNPTFSNTGTFMDSCFSPNVRTLPVLQAAINNGQFIADFTNGQAESLLDCLTMYWRLVEDRQANHFANYPRDTDKVFIAYLARFIRQHQLCWYQPIFVGNGVTPQGVPCYRLTRYSQNDLRPNGHWDYALVKQFLRYFLFGAHIVIVDSGWNAAARFYDDFQVQLAGRFRTGAMHSHYAGIISRDGLAYPSTVAQDAAPNPCPFLCSLLVGTTSREPYCSFLQLEGWPGVVYGGIQGRHSADYAVHNSTKWNISTFGACAYSEKRATALFLAAQNWNPAPRAGTLMPQYRGAETPQRWLATTIAAI